MIHRYAGLTEMGPKRWRFSNFYTHTHTNTHKHTQRTCEELTEQRNLGFVAQLVKNLSRVWAWGRKLVKK